MTENYKEISRQTLADDWGTLTKYTYELRRRDGTWQQQTREAYNRGNGAACLLHNPETDTILLTRQFRLPVLLNNRNPYSIEVPAGILDGAEPADRMRAELIEETGYQVSQLTHIFDLDMSPGSVTEYLAYFHGTYTEAQKVAEGGGHIEEGEDIEVLHIPLTQAQAMIEKGEICDGKTIILIQWALLQRASQASASNEAKLQPA